MKLKDLTGQRFGRLTVIERAPNQERRTIWRCACDCGIITTVRAENLQSGNTRSCGCLNIESAVKSNTTHGMSGTRLAAVFNSMKQRCLNKHSTEYHLYGGRGIKVCDEWLNNPSSFYSWALSSGYKENSCQSECSIDRIDVNGDYCPENCRWVDSYTQANNTRKNKYYEYMGQRHTLTEWSRIVGVNSGTIYSRINNLGWTLEEALTLPPSHTSQRVQ